MISLFEKESPWLGEIVWSLDTVSGGYDPLMSLTPTGSPGRRETLGNDINVTRVRKAPKRVADRLILQYDSVWIRPLRSSVSWGDCRLKPNFWEVTGTSWKESDVPSDPTRWYGDRKRRGGRRCTPSLMVKPSEWVTT